MAKTTAYQCDLGSNQWLHLSNDGSMTTVTVSSRGAGQQQQSSQGFVTGEWRDRPQVYPLAQGVVVAIATVHSTAYVQIQAGQAQLLSGQAAEQMNQFVQAKTSQSMLVQPVASTATTQPMTPMIPMAPMTPMTPMAPMAMNLNPMSMAMGNMAMSMGSSAASSATSDSTAKTTGQTAQSAKRFCTQCGSAVEPGDKFCGHCGDRLSA